MNPRPSVVFSRVVSPVADRNPVIALDVSSSATGVAYVFGGLIVGFGVLKPRQSMKSIDRIDATVDGIGRILAQSAPTLVVMEWSAGHVFRRAGKGTGLSVLGAAQGAVREHARNAGYAISTVDEKTWTWGRKKETRAKTITGQIPSYAEWALAGNDPGFDAADAIGVGLWWIANGVTVDDRVKGKPLGEWL